MCTSHFFRCSLCCVLSVLFFSFVFLFATLIFWIGFSPDAVEFDVTEATLTKFNFTTNNTLNFNLTLTMIVRNPNKKISISYDRVKASAYYKNRWLDTVALPPFYLGHKNTINLQPVFVGQELVPLDHRKLSKFNSEKSAGIYVINVYLKFRIGPKFGKYRTGHYDNTIRCNLKVPLSSDGSSDGKSAGGFQRTKCS